MGSFDENTGAWTVGDLASGSSATLTITTTVDTPDPITNTAQVIAADQFDIDSTPNNNVEAEDDQDSASTDPSAIDLSLTKMVDDPAPDVGGHVIWTITVANAAGYDDATGVAVGDVLPAGTTFVSASASVGAFDDATGVWTVGDLAAGSSATLTITTEVTTSDPVTNVAQVIAADQFDIDSTPNNNDPAEDDQDSASLDANDTPTGGNSSVTLDDEGLSGGIPGGNQDVAGEDTAVSDSVGWSTGIDGFGSLTLTGPSMLGSEAVTSVWDAGSNTLTISSVRGDLMTLEVTDTSTGDYTATLLQPLQHVASNVEDDISFDVSYTLTDADGDSANGFITINVDDDTPVATEGQNVGGIVDEDELPAGIGDNAPGDDAGGTTVNGNVGALFQSGADQPLTYSLTGDTTGLPALSSGGQTVSYTPTGNTLTASTSAGTVFTLVLTAATGAYTFTLEQPLDHPVAGTEDNIDLDFSSLVRATDADGDPVTANPGGLVITIDDDMPVVFGNLAVQLDDGALANGNPGGTGDVNPDTANTSGTLGLDFGADGAGSVVWLTTGAPAGFTYVASGDDLLIQQDGATVVTATLDTATGAYSITQNAPIDHPAGGDENDVSFSLTYQVTDADDDSATGSLTVNVDDDTPVATEGQNVGGIVDEDELPAGIGDNAPGDDAGGTTVNGNVGALFQSGADQPLTYSLTGDTTGLPALSSGGQMVSYTLTGNTLTASTSAGTVFTLVLTAATGAYAFTLEQPLDHPVAGTEDNIELDFSSLVRATDADGDPVTANPGGLVITIDDDMPVVFGNLAVQLDDGALTNGNPGGTGDVNPDTANTSGTLGHDFGADGAGSVVWLTTGAPAGFTYVAAGDDLLIQQDGVTVVTATLDTATGAYSITQNAPIDHPAGGDENDVSFSLAYQVTDGDDDSATGSLTVNVDDDTPVAISPDNATLINAAGAMATEELDLGDGNIDDNVGADQTGSISFANITNGQDSGYTSAGQTVFLYISADGQTLTGATGTGPGDGDVFTIQLNPDGDPAIANDTYTVTIHQPLDNGSGIVFTDLSGVKAGNTDFIVVDGDTQGADVDLRFSPVVGSSVNTSSTDIGIDNQMFDPGETMRIDFGEFSTTDGTGVLTTVNGVGITLPQTQPTNNTADVKVTAYDGATADTITEVQVIRGGTTYSSLDPVTAATAGITFVAAGASVIVQGVEDPDQIVTFTADGYDALEVANAADDTSGGDRDADFSLGGITIQSAVTGDPVDLSYDVELIDADGDSAGIASLDITLNPDTAPVALDLDGDGLEFLGMADASVLFDFDGDGVAEAGSWVGPDDGILVYDANSDGVVNDGTELAFAGYAPTAQTDLEGLQLAFDSNGDNLLDARDATFGSFGVWQDANSNGLTDEGELSTLADAGIESISLVSDGAAYSAANGQVVVHGETTYTNTDGSTGTVGDVSLSSAPAGTDAELPPADEVIADETMDLEAPSDAPEEVADVSDPTAPATDPGTAPPPDAPTTEETEVVEVTPAPAPTPDPAPAPEPAPAPAPAPETVAPVEDAPPAVV